MPRASLMRCGSPGLRPTCPRPKTRRSIRIARLAQALSQHELDLYARRSEHDDKVEERRGGKPFAPWQAIRTLPSAPAAAWSLLPGPASMFPAALWRLLEARHTERPYDAVIIEQCHAGHGLARLDDVAVVLDEHNIESRFFLRQLRTGPNRGRALSRWLRWRRWERRMWQAVDRITVVSEADLDAVRRVRPDAGPVVPNGIALEAYRFIRPSDRASRAVLFVGQMSYPPNVEAARLLARAVLPELRRSVPGATLTITGRDPGPEVRALAGEAVRVTGTLPSVAGLFDDHGAYAMPLSLGAGSSLKVLEPLATGLPLIASRFAVRGFPVESERHYRAAETPTEFARILAEALTERARFDPIAERGRQMAQSYRWDEIGACFARSVEDAVWGRRSKHRRPLDLTF